MKKHGNSFAKIFSIILVIAIVFFAGMSLGQRRAPSEFADRFPDGNAPSNQDIDIFFDVWRTLDDRYPFADGPTTRELILGATEGLAEAYNDPYTVFFAPEAAKVFDEEISGEFSGVGMEVGVEDGFITVIAPLKDSPAEQAGIRAGDQILQIDGTFTHDLALDEAVQLIRGDRGTTVTILVARTGETQPVSIDIVRDTIQVPTIETELLEEDIFVIELYNFTENSAVLFQDALSEFANSGTNKLILDLRGNPGGYLSSAVDMASFFLPEGKVIVRESLGKDGEGEVFRSRGFDVFDDSLEMVILIDGGSASASEILAGALSEYEIAELVGMPTFGKGSVQEVLPIRGGSLLKVTIAEWLTPNGVSISDSGLRPDHEVEYTLEDAEADRDPQRDFAIELLSQ